MIFSIVFELMCITIFKIWFLCICSNFYYFNVFNFIYKIIYYFCNILNMSSICIKIYISYFII